MSRFKQTVRIGRNVTDIMALPCVNACLKMSDGNGYTWLEYVINEGHLVFQGDGNRAEEGDWLCQDAFGDWEILTDEEYQEILKKENDLWTGKK